MCKVYTTWTRIKNNRTLHNNDKSTFGFITLHYLLLPIKILRNNCEIAVFYELRNTKRNQETNATIRR